MRAIQHGDRRWSAIHLHPVATPGRWLRTLDLRDAGFDGRYERSLAPADRIYSIFSLIPNLAHLSFHPRSAVPAAALLDAPFLPALETLQGMWLTSDAPHEIIDLLRRTPQLEVLGLCVMDTGRSNGTAARRPDAAPVDQDLPLALPHLHSLRLDSIWSRPAYWGGDFCAALPALRRLCVRLDANDQIPLAASHGHQIQSLVIHLCYSRTGLGRGGLGRAFPNLACLTVCQAARNAFLPAELLDAADLPASLHTVVLQSDALLGALRAAPRLGAAGPGAAAFDRLVRAPPTGLRDIVLVGHRWPAEDNQEAAVLSSSSDPMLALAKRLKQKGINLRDERGSIAPDCA